MSTLRLMIPEWHGGMNPNYVLWSELLACIADFEGTESG